MYQATETQTERLHDEWLRELAASALEVLVDEAMCEYPWPDKGIGTLEFNLRVALGETFEKYLNAEQLITWAAKLSTDVLSFEAFEARETE